MKFIKMVVLLLYFGVALTHAALAAQEEGYNITVPDYIDIEKNLTISNILSYSDVTKAYDAAPWGLDWGKNRAPYKWKVTMAKGDVTIGFERYETISTNPQVITFYRTVTEQRGSHPETRYREARPVQKAGIMGISAGIQATGWWNSAWQYRIDNPLPNGVRPYQLSLTLSNSAGTNTATHIFLNGHAKSDFSDIRFTLNNAIELPYWIESAATGKVWVRVPDNGIVNIYYGNPSASSLSNGKSTFEFFDDFNTLDLGSNPVIVPTQTWETVGYLRWGTIAYLNGIYYIYYTNGASSTSDIGRASSTDLITWTKNANNPVILNRIGPSLLKDLDGKTPVFVDGKYWMLTMKSDGSAIELRSSPAIDGNTWTLENANLIPKGGTWHTNYLYTTSFVRENGNYYIVMESGTPGVSWKIGYFKASTPKGPYIDNGVLLSPTLPWEGKGVLDPEMRKFGNTYYLFYTGNDVFPYQNSWASSLSLGGAYQKSSIIVTPGGQSYPAILQKDSYYYILADDQPTKYTGKSLFTRKDLNGPFGSPFEWNKGGTPTVSGSELLINANGEFLRSSSNFLYKAMKIRAKYASTSAANSYQYFGFVPSSAASENPSEMFFSRENPTNIWVEAWSGNSANSESTQISNPNYFGSYHNYEILWRNGEAKFIIDDALKATQTTSVADSSMPVGIYDYNTAANLAVDWVFVRNYVSPEPAWGVWSAEQASQNGGAPSITGLPHESQVSDIVGAIRTFNITANQAVNVTWYLNSVIVKDTEKSVTQATYTNTSASMGAWNVSAVVSNTNGSAIQTWTWDVSSTNTASGIFFTDPTPANGATLNQNYVYINTTVMDFNTAFIDWNHSLAGWWRFNSESGENSAFFRDWSSLGNNGTCSGTSCPISIPGKYGNALQFDGVNDYLNAGNGGSVTGSLTITAWIKRGTNSAWRTIVSKGESKQEYDHNYVLYVSPRNTLTLGFGKNDGATYRDFETTTPIDTNWHHIVAVINSATDMKIYVDGVSQVGTFTGSSSTVLTANTKKLLIGSSSTTAEFFNGAIDEVTIWNRALSPEEIKASYNAGINRLLRNFTSLADGTYAYTAYAQNLAGDVNQTETRTVAVTSFLPDVPLITFFAPLSPLTNAVGDSRTFNITINNPVNMTWYLNGVVIKNSEKGVTQASYSNTSASQGTWIINATATNTNGTVSKEWIWNVGQNAVFYQTIFNTDGSITFKNKNNGNIILTSAPQYFLNYCQGTNCFEITNGNINPTVVTEGNLTYITAIDDTNAYAKVTHYYELDAASPYIKYTATLRYKQNVTVTGERFVFNVPDKGAQVMTRDLKIIPFDNLKTYWSDLYTPKVIKFNNGLYFVASDTMESMKLQTSGTGSLVSFYSDYNENHPHFHYIRNGAGQITYTSGSIRSINDTYSASITFAINPSASPKTLIKTRQPYGYDAALTLTNHADNEMLTRIAAVAYGTEDEKAPDYGTKGIAGRGIGWTKSVFVSGCSPPVGTDDCYQGADLQDIDFKAQTDKLYNDGVEIVGHTTMPEIESTSMVSAGVQTLSQYNTRNWIDHGASGGISNWEDLASQGAIKGDSNYVLDIFDQYNYKYAWSYIDLPTTSYGPNMLEPAKTEEVRPFFFYNNQVDNNVYDSKRIYLWSTINTKQVPDLYYTNSNIDSLISERGMHIGHEYMAIDTINNHAWYISGGITKIYPAFDSELANIASKKENGLLWSPTMSTLGDYLVSLKDITVIYNSDGTYNITNFGSSSITGITLLAEDTIQSATIDEQSLVSFGGSYGNNEMILPPLAAGQSVNLKIIYGAKDTSIPTITSNDAGKTRVNEITGIWDNKTRQLTMTAKGTSVTRSFTVRIPNLANKIITVEDTTSGTTIGSYAASGNGDITFLAPLGSLHTFRIGEFEESATGPAITSFAPNSPTVNDYTGSTRSFNFTVNQTVNVSWYLNGVVIKNSEKGIQQASYTNTSASIGTWNVSAIASNSKGTLMKTWTWNVMSQSPSDVKSITVSPSDISVIRRGTMQLNIPTYDGSGQAVHPDVYYNANGWRGYKYWMVMTPYPNGNDAYENPSILVSNDGISWSVPQGLQNPIDPKPASGSNSDVDIVYNETADRIEIYYVESGAGTSYLIRKTSADGITWSAEKNTMLVPDYQVMSPAIIKNGSVYDMWYTGGASCSADTTVKFANSADGLNWSSPQMVNIKTDLNIWHLDVSYIPSQNEYWMVYAAYPKGSTCGNTDLYFAKSKDKINWTNYPDIIIKRGTSWDSSQIYRSTFLFNDTSNTMRIWYSARGGVAWHIGYVEKQYFSAKAKDQSGQTVNVSIMWASSNVYVGTITSGGLFSALSNGMTTITASNGTVSGTANVQVTDASLPVQPSITSYIPASPISDIEGATRTFSVTVNQRVNVTWFINSNQVQINGSVSSASYTNTNASIGTWNVTASVQNANGTAMQEWVWIVTPGDETIPQTIYIVSLKTGWNLISAPLNLTTWNLDDESAVGNPLNVTPTNCISSIYRYNSTSNLFEKSEHFDNWGWYPATGSESFTALEPGRGYWAMAQQDCSLTFTGTAPFDLDIPLNTGWNLIGWYSMNEAALGEEMVVGNPLNVTPTNSLTSIYRYNTTSALFEKSDRFLDWGWYPATGSDSFTKLEPGRGYWLMAKNNANWVFNSS